MILETRCSGGVVVLLIAASSNSRVRRDITTKRKEGEEEGQERNSHETESHLFKTRFAVTIVLVEIGDGCHADMYSQTAPITRNCVPASSRPCFWLCH